jgi:hypothetical protein
MFISLLMLAVKSIEIAITDLFLPCLFNFMSKADLASRTTMTTMRSAKVNYYSQIGSFADASSKIDRS